VKKKNVLIIIFILLVFSLTSCVFIQRSTIKKQIVTTLYPEYDMVKKIIGTDQEMQNLFDVTMIIKPGQDSHTYDPSVKDLITIKNADIFIYTADEMETWVSDLSFSNKTLVINLSKSDDIELLRVEDEDEEEHIEEKFNHEHTHVHAYDPHYWIYPIYAVSMVRQIKQAISNSLEDPLGTRNKILDKNANEYINQLLKIDEDLKMIVDNAQNKTMYFGSPFSFYYLAYFYGLEYELVYSTCSTETEPSIDTLIYFIKKMKEEDITVVFSKELINTEACKMISSHTGAIILELHSGHNVSALDFNNPNISYLSIMRQNVVNLAKMLKVDQTILKNLEEGE
jgi:ABC-type metal ion transport system, periplasmic component/surface adhesin